MDIMHKTKRTGLTNIIFTLFSVAIIIGIWWWLAESHYGRFGVIPTPPDTFRIVWQELQKEYFWEAKFSTLWKALRSFVISFLCAIILAMLAHWKKPIRNLINPFIVITRAMPTMALVLILLLTVGSNMLPIVVAFLVVFPLCYENMLTAISGVDRNLVRMAKVFKVPTHRQVTGIYLPAMLPYVFSSTIAGFGLNIKVVISAEVLGLPSMSIGYLIMTSRLNIDFSTAFAWLVIAVILSLICEIILRIIRRFCMPWKYPDLKIMKNTSKRIFIRRKMKEVASDSI